MFSVESLRILAVNSAAQDWLGYDAQTLQAMTIIDLRPPAERAQLVTRVRQFEGTVTDAGTWTIVGKSGDHYAASFAWSKVVFEGTEAIVASIRDVTRTVRAETRADSLSKQNEALRKSVSLSAEHLSRLFDGLPGKMLVLTPGDYRMVAVTEEYAEAVMQERGEIRQ
ncbi:PAS domain-containing protein [Aquibaculum arenosum]|uniref:PAS domain-containing protein n=1 Tax=Aquibaculum arenosum TaxID=3032591 RepID=A0ABT5YRW9_9PROT|nr:PAS domain-containing protein [Fodinicurvata sp. CAU 1616]MDF2097526.1 PAS domain-containing protein [Fodinicurvata sp. CAU 1616]